MEFKHLQSFVAVVELKSFTKAAEKLYLTQPTVSTQMHQLEEELQTPLLYRTTKSLQVTPEGLKLYDYAKGILRLQEKIYQRCSGSLQKVIHIGASTIPSAYLLPQLIASYQKMKPSIQYEIHREDSQGIISGIMAGQFDIGFTGMKSRENSLSFTALCKDHMILITPATEYFQSLKENEEEAIPELLKMPFILREEGSGSRQGALHFLDRANLKESDLSIKVRTDDTEMIKQMVAAGIGISIISDLAITEEVKQKKLLSFSFEQEPCSRDFYIVTKKDYPYPDYINAFLEYLSSVK